MLPARRLGRAALFAAAAGAAAWVAWPQPGVGHAAVSQFHVIATVLVLAGLPPKQPAYQRIACPFRGFGCGAVPGKSTGGPP